jgi:aspartate aminotransferase-like enzyme
LSKLFPTNDPSGLLEYSVVYTDRALNHMSQGFQGVMRDISGILKEVYKGKSAIVVPGSGTFGMEAVARQFATGTKMCWCYAMAGSATAGRRFLKWEISLPAAPY